MRSNQSSRNMILAFVAMSWCALLFLDANAQGFWECTNGPYGGGVQVLAIDGSGNLFAGQGSSTIYRSTNKGDSWVAFSTTLFGTYADKITCFSSGPHGYVFAGTDEPQIGPSWLWRGARILRSTDHGATWLNVFSNDPDYSYVGSFAVDDSEHVFATTNRRLLRSDDSGSSWKVVNTGLDRYSGGALAVDNHGHLWLGMYNLGLYRSTGNGENMVYIGFNNVNIYELVIPASGHIFLATSAGFYRSTDEGASWDLLSPVLPNAPIRSFVLNASGHLFATPSDGTQNYGVFRSTDNGETWLPVDNGLINRAVSSLAVHPDGDIFVGTNGAGVFRSTDNADSWTPASQELGGAGVYALVEHPGDGTIWAGTSGAGIFRYQKDAEQWVSRNTGLTHPSVLSLTVNSRGHLLAGTMGEILRSTDFGTNWQPLFTVPHNQTVISFAKNAFGYLLAGTSGTYDLGGAIFRSTDDGDTWTEVYRGGSYARYYDIVANADGHFFAAGTDCDIIRSLDNGEHWTLANSGFPYKIVYALAINSHGHLFVAGGSYVKMYRSTDNGESWKPMNDFFRFIEVRTLVINAHDEIFAGTQGSGVYMSQDDGATWAQLDPQPKSCSGSLLYCDQQGYIWTSGVCRSTQSTTAVHEPQSDAVASFYLEQNYPNPFNPVTSIQYTVTGHQHVSLKVYDVLGNEAATLVNTKQPAGFYRVTFDGRGLASGVYLLHLHAGNFVAKRKMLLTK